MAASPSSASDRHVDSLDGVRTLAILAVMFVHAGTPGFQSGWLGVDLFFALSGFLITTLLLQEHARNGRISYSDFLVRRALRLMPAYLLYVALMTYGIWGWPGSVTSAHGGWTPLGYTVALWTYAVNFAPSGGIWNGQDVTIHLWSLAVEQQYYLIWPIIVIALAHRPRQLLLAGCVVTGATLLAFVLRTDDGLYKTSMLFTRGFTLAMASTLAIAAYQNRDRVKAWPWRWITVVGVIVVIMAFGLAATHRWTEAQVRANLLPLLSLVFSLWITSLWYCPLPKRLGGFLLNPAVQYIGKVSYGVYLYHELVRVAVWHYGKPLMESWPTSVGYLTRLVVYVALSVLVAALSYEFIEKSFLKLRKRFRPAARPIPAAEVAQQRLAMPE
ncbi:MAG: acyltransferase [Rhizobacter sp.]|nr:acyltransferase [Rhizobacter sp.]